MNNKLKKIDSSKTPKQLRANAGPATAGEEYDLNLDTLTITPDNKTLRRQFSPSQLLHGESDAGVSNGADTSDDVLFQVTIPATMLKANGKSISFSAMGLYANNANNKTVKTIFGSQTLVTSGVVTSANTVWQLFGEIVKTASGSQQIVANYQVGSTLTTTTYTHGTQTDTADIILKITGASPTSGAAGDVKGFYLQVFVNN